MSTVGITGHRKIVQEPGELQQFARLSVARMVVEAHASEIITGMALGWDLAVAEACIDLRVPFIAAVPFMKQPSLWAKEDQARWERCLLAAYHVDIGSTIPGTKALLDRNRWIVDQCDELWPFYDGSPKGGTRHCVLYAEEVGRRMVPLWGDWLQFRQENANASFHPR